MKTMHVRGGNDSKLGNERARPGVGDVSCSGKSTCALLLWGEVKPVLKEYCP